MTATHVFRTKPPVITLGGYKPPSIKVKPYIKVHRKIKKSKAKTINEEMEV